MNSMNQKVFWWAGRLVLVLVIIGVIVLEVKMLRKIAADDFSGEKVISSGMADVKEVVVGAAVVEEIKMETVSGSAVADDAWPELIKRYLAKYKSPLLPYSNLIYELSKTYGFEPYWILAIGQQESNLCKKIPENSYNCWGYGIHSKGTLRFESYEAALKSYAEYLKRVYFDKGLNTPELIMKKYCPHSNGSWAYGVGHFIEEIEAGSF